MAFFRYYKNSYCYYKYESKSVYLLSFHSLTVESACVQFRIEVLSFLGKKIATLYRDKRHTHGWSIGQS